MIFMNVILGSGIVGLLAKEILGDSWTVIPFTKSRFYTWNPALDDNFIIADSDIDPFINELMNRRPNLYPYKRSWSIMGDLKSEYDEALCTVWLSKIFSGNYPQHALAYYKDRQILSVYDIRANELYERLLNKHMPSIAEEYKKGKVTKIGDHKIERGNHIIEYDKIVSTIPLYALLEFMGKKANLEYKPINYIHLYSEHLDFEGANQTLVVDNNIDFFKVSNISKNKYLFYFHENVVNYGAYLMNYIKDFDILDGTVVGDAIPVGSMPNLDTLEKDDIFCVGSYAQWDWCADVGSNIKRLIKYSNRSNKPAKPKVFNEF